MPLERDHKLARSAYRATVRAPYYQVYDGVSVHDFGRNPEIDSATAPEDVIPQGGVQYWPSAAATTTVLSDDANDTDGGTGARTVRVIGLINPRPGEYVWADEEIALDGTNPVTLTQEFFRVMKAIVLTAGSNETNIGTIDVRHGSNILCEVPPDFGESDMAIYAIPTAYYAELDRWSVEIEGSNSARATVAFQIRNYSLPDGAWRTMDFIELGEEQPRTKVYETPVPIPPMHDIRVRVLSSTANGIAVESDFDILAYRRI